MSVSLMGAAFKLGIPASEKLVLLAMADHARDDGTGCYPSIELLARKTSQTRRGVQKIMRRLEDAGLISPSKVSRGGPHRSTEYSLTLGNREPGSLFPSTQPRTPGRPTANARTPNREPECAKQRTGFARTIKNHHGTVKEPAAAASPRSSSPVGRVPEETVSRLAGSKSMTPVGKTPKELDARRRLLLDQANAVQKKFQNAGQGKAKAQIGNRYARIGLLADRAIELLEAKPHKSDGDLAEELKQFAAANDITYFDALSGAATPIQQAITIATERRKTA